MRILVTLEKLKNDDNFIKMLYRSSQQALIYDLLNPYYNGEGNVKDVSFSGIKEQYVFTKGYCGDKLYDGFKFPNIISFNISSSNAELLNRLLDSYTKDSIVKLSQLDFKLKSIEEVMHPREITRYERIVADTPIEIHKNRSASGHFTKYYGPGDKEFSDMINSELHRKWKAFKGYDCEFNIKIKPINIELCKKRFITFKKIHYISWVGHYRIKGDVELIEFALDVGLGMTTTGGFGYISMVKKTK